MKMQMFVLCCVLWLEPTCLSRGSHFKVCVCNLQSKVRVLVAVVYMRKVPLLHIQTKRKVNEYKCYLHRWDLL